KGSGFAQFGRVEGTERRAEQGDQGQILRHRRFGQLKRDKVRLNQLGHEPLPLERSICAANRVRDYGLSREQEALTWIALDDASHRRAQSDLAPAGRREPRARQAELIKTHPAVARDEIGLNRHLALAACSSMNF
ncbi:hypothetical protein chiPu_0033678, partial [Chiloscyllium punctatum]|nr:hypothetical protein [Chiloscyllium punctatum]